MSKITAHMIVKNEDQWVWYSIQSVLPYVDEFFITDTGSTDKTNEIISSLGSPKIKYSKITAITSEDLTKIRMHQLMYTKNPWIWLVDGDEIYPKITAEECVKATSNPQYEGVLVRRLDLLGDIYHRQSESIGTYELFGNTGHLLVRLINKEKNKGLEYQGDYPNEGLFDHTGNSILNHEPSLWYLTTNYLYHAMYLKRSSLGGNLPMYNRSKYKIETGIKIDYCIPEVFYLDRPPGVSNPLAHRDKKYELAASIITPIKNLKRKLL